MKDIRMSDTVLQDHLAALSPDSLDTFLLSFGEEKESVRGAVLNGTRLLNEMRSAHELGILESLILGQAYLGALLMTRSLKGMGRIQLDIGCAGPVEGLSVEANAAGDVRGYLKQVPIPINAPVESFDTSPFFGPGILSVNRYPDGAKQPFTGNIDLQYGNIGQDIANYYLVSEQTRTSVAVSIKFDNSGRIIGGGGLFLEALPGASDEILDAAQAAVSAMPSPGELFSRGHAGPDMVQKAFNGFQLTPLENRKVRFHCPCSRERFKSFISALNIEDLKEMSVNGPFPVITVCHNCNTSYGFEQTELENILHQRSSGKQT